MRWPSAPAAPIAEARVAVEWWTTLIDPDTGEITLPGCLLLRFAPDGRCQDLWEYWQVRPGREAPSFWLGKLTCPIQAFRGGNPLHCSRCVVMTCTATSRYTRRYTHDLE